MHIKICGLTCLDDAFAAIDAGADYLGFNFYPRSPRHISPNTCAKSLSASPSAIRHHHRWRLRQQICPFVAAILDHCGPTLPTARRQAPGISPRSGATPKSLSPERAP
jgi:hypothetical protein